MNERLVRVPELVRQKALHLGPQGARWLIDLPEVISHLARVWSIRLGEPLTGGSASYVVRARTMEGRDAVLKIALPEQGVDAQIRTMASAQGRGYAKLLAYDLDRHAMLLEALGPSAAELDLPPESIISLLCQMLREAWQAPRPEGLAVSAVDEKAARLAHLVATTWERLGHPCSERVLRQALNYAARRGAAFAPDRCVVVHGDPHPWNALRVLAPRAGAPAGYVFVDPDGFLADPAYDLGVVLRDWCQHLLAGDAVALAHHYCALLSAETGIAEDAIWEWGFLERVSTGLYALEVGAEDLGRPFLQTAELLV